MSAVVWDCLRLSPEDSCVGGLASQERQQDLLEVGLSGGTLLIGGVSPRDGGTPVSLHLTCR